MSNDLPSPAGLLETVLGFCRADQAEVAYEERREATTRFANNAITQNTASRSTALTVRVAFGERVGQATGNDFSEDGLRDCVRRAEAIARVAEPDPEFLPLPGPQEYPRTRGFDERAAQAGPEERAAGVRRVTELAQQAELQAAGSFTTGAFLSAVANSQGLYHEDRLTEAQIVATAMTPDSSGWAQTTASSLEGIDPERCGQTAVSKALAARDPREIAPGEYTVVLEPAAAGDFFWYLAHCMDAREADEGRSAFAEKEGCRIGAPGVTLSTQPDHPRVPVRAASEDGLPLPATTWIEDGVLRTLSYGRYWAEKTGRPFTGKLANMIMAGGDHSLEEVIASVERGVLVTRFWYIRMVDPMKLLVTGMTRDGLYWIEDGQVRHGLKNMRFNDSPLACLQRIGIRGPRQRVGRYAPAYMPALRLDGFRFTSGTSF